MADKKRGLGRGLEALLGQAQARAPSPAGESADKPARPGGDELARLPVDLLERGKYQPRLDMREESLVGVLGASSHVLRSTTYKYPPFTFAPSTAPDEWIWRNVIPYELAIDTVEGDILVTWQPTWSLSPRTLLGVRGSLGFAGGSVGSKNQEEREHYFSVGLDLTRLTGKQLLSSWGAMAGYYRTFNTPAVGQRDAMGADAHLGLFKDRLRLAIGTRDVSAAGDNWFLLIGVTDLPGLSYWLTR